MMPMSISTMATVLEDMLAPSYEVSVVQEGYTGERETCIEGRSWLLDRDKP